MSTNEPIIKIKQLDIPKDVLEKIAEVKKSGKFSGYYKKRATREILGHTFCACGELPFYKISRTENEITIVEHICLTCYQKDQARAKEEPELRTSESLAEFYECSVAPEGTFGKSNRYE